MGASPTQSSSNSAETPTIRNRINEELRNRGLADLDEEEELEQDEERQIEMGVKVNVFDYCEANFVQKGDVIQYDIDRNGQFVATKMHPYSWEQLQSEFGEGHYRVQAKSAHTKAYRKQESRFVAAAPVSAKDNQTTIAECPES
jgi:NCAIR mutase (PurE)-related protein